MRDMILAIVMFTSLFTVMILGLQGLSNTQTNVQKIVSDLNGVK